MCMGCPSKSIISEFCSACLKVSHFVGFSKFVRIMMELVDSVRMTES